MLDDIIVCGRNKAEHDKNLEMVLSRLSEFNATINIDKCLFGADQVDFVGHTISKDGVQPLQSNIDALLRIPPPTNTKEVHSFLSTANYYLKFVPHFSQLAEPLRTMLKKDSTFHWNDRCQNAFEQIKQEIASHRVLAHFDTHSHTIVSTDASGIALGAVLSQVQHGKERPIAFASRTLQPAERAYSVGEREALACIWACEHWHYYLYGRKFTLRTDHSALTTLLAGSTTGRKPMRLLRWADRLHQYNFDVVYRPGKENNVADLLSRAVQSLVPSQVSSVEINADLQTLNTIFGSPALRAISPQELAAATYSDPILQQVLEHISNGWPKQRPNIPELHSFFQVQEELTTANGCIFRGNRAVIPVSLQLRVIQIAHEGHAGIVRTKQRCRECVWWPGIDHHIESYISNCTACTISDKGKHALPIPPLKPIQYPSKPWSKLSLDILGELHGVPQHSRFLIVLLDMHSKWPEVKAVSNINTHSVTTFLSELFSRWGLPEEIITDNGRQFVSSDFEQFLSQLGIRHCKTALYHPQANGAVERFNRVLKEGIRAYKTEGTTFEDTLRSILANYRSTVHSTTGQTPAELMIGRRFRMPLDMLALKPPLKKVLFSEHVEERVFNKQQKYKAYADTRRRAKHSNLQPGDSVRVKVQDRHSKLDPVWSSPRLVVEKTSDDTVKLEDGTTWNAEKLLVESSHSETPDASNSSADDHPESQPVQNPDPDVAPSHDSKPVPDEVSSFSTTSTAPHLANASRGSSGRARGRPRGSARGAVGRGASAAESASGDANVGERRSTRTRHAPKRYEEYNTHT